MIGIKINNPQQLDLQLFCQYLIPLIRARANDFSKIDIRVEKLWDSYLQELFKKYKVTINLKTIVRIYFNNLVIRKDMRDKSYTITVNDNIKFPGLDIKIDALAQLITIGNLDIAGYPLFDDIYEDIKIKVPTLYNIWKGL